MPGFIARTGVARLGDEYDRHHAPPRPIAASAPREGFGDRPASRPA